MGVSHYRKGPSKVSTGGYLQPISDAEKLLLKENLKMGGFKLIFYSIGPIFSVFVILFCWGWYNFSFRINPTSIKFIIIISFMSFIAYGFMFTSWGSNTKYSLLGGNRAIAQVLSYEVCLVLFALLVIYSCKNFSLSFLTVLQENFWLIWLSLPTFFFWLTLCLAESNRTPFDTAEGESEIVSGFNIEYGSGFFAFIFIREYGMIIVVRFLTTIIFLGGIYIVKVFLLCFFYVWARCSFPRLRYDQLILNSWKILLPQSVAACLLSLSFL